VVWEAGVGGVGGVLEPGEPRADAPLHHPHWMRVQKGNSIQTLLAMKFATQHVLS